MSSTMPPDQPTQPSATSGTSGAGRPSIAASDIARLPIPGNAEFLVYLLVELIFTLLWWFRDDVDTQQWMTLTTALTAFYLLSRGIAKASRVLEQ